MPERAWDTFGRAPAPLINRVRTRTDRPCPCGCRTAGFCPEHRARLAAIREALVADGKRKGPRKGRAIAGIRGVEHDLEEDE